METQKVVPIGATRHPTIKYFVRMQWNHLRQVVLQQAKEWKVAPLFSFSQTVSQKRLLSESGETIASIRKSAWNGSETCIQICGGEKKHPKKQVHIHILSKDMGYVIIPSKGSC